MVIILITFYINIQADDAFQVFKKVYDSDGWENGQHIYKTLDGGYLIGGVHIPANSSDYHPYLLKLKPDWSVDWLNLYGEFSCDYCSFTQVCDDESYAIAGQYFNPDSSSLDIFLIKVDYLGNVVQSYTYDYAGDQVVRTFRKTPDGGFLVGGRWIYDSFLMKMDRDFNPVWINILGGSELDHIYACQVASDSEFVAAGYTMSYGMGDADLLLVRLSLDGQIKSAEAIGSANREAVSGDKGLYLTRDGGVIMAGYNNINDANGNDFLLVKVDAAGAVQWAKTYGGYGVDNGFMGEETSDSGFVMVGYSSSFSPQFYDGYMLKTDKSGTLEWSKAYGTENSNEVMGCVLQDSANSLIFSGGSDGYGSRDQGIFVVKTDSAGNSGTVDKSVESITREPELAVTPIADLELQLIYKEIIEFPISATSIDAADISVYTISSDWIGRNNPNPVPEEFDLKQNYPNPFNPVTTIEYSIPRNSYVTLRIYDITGQEIKTLINDNLIPVGNYEIEWDGKDNNGNAVASGTYFYQLETEGYIKARKMIHVK